MVSLKVIGFSFHRNKSKYWCLTGKLQHIITIIQGILFGFATVLIVVKNELAQFSKVPFSEKLGHNYPYSSSHLLDVS